MTDKTAIELIYEMYEMLQKMETRLEFLEKEVRLINDKANGKMFEAISRELPRGASVDIPSPTMEISLPTGQTVIGPERLQNSTVTPPPARQQNVRAFGKFLDIRNKPIPEIEVTILDANNTVVKQTRTNRAGEFTSFLPPGQYSAEFIKENMAPQFKTFEVIQGQREVEVM